MNTHEELTPQELIEWLNELEAPFSRNNYCGEEGPAHKYMQGKSKVAITAEHSVWHTNVNGDPKPYEPYTGGLACLMHEMQGVHALVRLRERSSENAQKAFEHFMHHHGNAPENKKAKAVIDLHGAKKSTVADIALGTSGPMTQEQWFILAILMSEAVNFGFKISVNEERYAANSPRTLTSKLKKTGITCVQMEINKRLRTPEQNPEETARFIAYLSKACKRIEKYLTPDYR